MHFPKSLTASQNFSQIIPTEVCVRRRYPQCRSLHSSCPPQSSVIFPAANPDPGPPGVSLQPPHIVLLLSERGRFLTSNMQPEIFHLTSPHTERKKVGVEIFLVLFYSTLSINETSHSEHWENLGIQWQKSQESIEKGKCFCYLCQNGRANFGFITPPPVTFHWASLSKGWVRSAGVDILLF